ncbi:hypothetical protein SteCoe_31125 [Stentor coeruleus]|uniref:Uncharacterized protein n=1 Tax=Stentor coeruleus TaxID=5963 RepID=A0A1R2B2B4_9CILI|nr:hypothetical protein SteCoe_31125 [Stentor coeruleus]
MSGKLKLHTKVTLGELIEKQSPIKESQLIRVLIKKKKSEKTVKKYPVFNLIKLNPEISFKQTVVMKDESIDTIRNKSKCIFGNISNSNSSSPSKDHRALSARSRIFSSNKIVYKDPQENFRNSSKFGIRNAEILNFLRNKNKYFPKGVVIKRKVA